MALERFCTQSLQNYSVVGQVSKTPNKRQKSNDLSLVLSLQTYLISFLTRILQILGSIIRTNLILNKQHLFRLTYVTPILDAFSLQILNETTVGLHRKFYFFDDTFWRNIAGSKCQNDFSFRIIRERHDLFSFPGYFIIFKRVGRRHTLAIHDHELFTKIYANIDVKKTVLPFLVYLVFEGKFNIATTYLHCVYKK